MNHKHDDCYNSPDDFTIISLLAPKEMSSFKQTELKLYHLLTVIITKHSFTEVIRYGKIAAPGVILLKKRLNVLMWFQL